MLLQVWPARTSLGFHVQLHRSDFTLSSKGTGLLHMSKASLALSPAQVRTHGKLSQGASQAEHESVCPLGWFSAVPLPRSCLPAGGTSIRAGIKSPSAAAHTAVCASSTVWCRRHRGVTLVWAVLGHMCLSWMCACVCMAMSMYRSFLTDITELSSQAWKLVHTWFLSWLGKASPSCCQ